MARRLRKGGFAPELAYHAYHAPDGQITGFTLWQRGHTFTPDELPHPVAKFFAEFPPAEHPYLYEHAEQHLAGFGRQGPSAFEFVLDLILDGLERARDATR